MNNNKRYLRLKRLLNPSSIVFVGGAALEPVIGYTRALGFDGSYHVVNLRRKRLCGIDCVRSATELKSPPDVAFVAVPAAAAIDAVADLARAGVGAAIVNSSGFAETGEAGAILEARLLEAAGKMPLIGPNCPGIASFLDRFGAMLDDMGVSDAKRGVAVLSHGGAYLADITGAERSLPIALIAGLGNQASVSTAELLEVILDDERISAVNLHLESIYEVERLTQCALKAHHKGIPVVVVMAGRSQAGRRAAITHSASATSDTTVASALFERLGFVEVSSASEALETLKMLTLAPAPKGPRMALVTGSGSYSVMGADFAESCGFTLPPLTAETHDLLRPLIPDFLAPGNPLNVATAQFAPDEDQLAIFNCFLADDFDIAVQSLPFLPKNPRHSESWHRSVRMFAAADQTAGLPAVFVSSTHEGLPKAAREMLIGLGVAPLQGFELGMRAIAHALDRHQRRKRMNPDNMLLPAPPAADLPKSTQLDEADSKELLDEFGIPVPNGRRVSAQAALPDDLGFPVVLKACDTSIPRKSDIGGVSLHLVNAELLNFARMQMIASLQDHGHEARQFLVEESIRGGIAELLVAIRLVANIGFMLTMSIRGAPVEQLNDSVNLLLPCNRDHIGLALARLKLYPTLLGVRGGSAADIESALDTIEALSAFAHSRSDIVEISISPLILLARDHGAIVADALIGIKSH